MEESGENNRKRKKGVQNVQKYKRNIIKKAKISGEEHANWKGHRVHAKNDPDYINRNCCKKKCLQNIEPPEMLDNILIKFYDLKTKNEQDLYLQSLVSVSSINRPRSRSTTEKQKPKLKTVSYNLTLKGVRIPVCKKAFINCHNVSTKRVRRIVDLLQKDEIPVDQRGRQSSSNAIPASINRKIHEHIESFPVRESHYTTRSYKYLSASLTVKQMWKLFITKYPELAETVKYSYYWSYFRKNFDLSFGSPAKDVCSQCEAFKTKIKSSTLNDIAKRVATAELLVHKRRSNKFYTALQNSSAQAKENNKILSICFDYMAVVDLPKIPVQEVYYYRQLSLNTFGIYNNGSDQITCYVYHEGVARKSPDEVCSFLVHYLQNYVDSAVEEVHLFCDNCAGQNKNHAMVRMLMALIELKMFKKIKLHFPIRGHSFLPCDRAFGLIKRKLKLFDRLYSVDEYIHSVVMQSSNIREKFIVFKPDLSITQDYQNWYPNYYFKTKRSEPRENVPSIPFTISNYHYFEFNSREPKAIRVSEFIGGLVKHYFHLRRPGQSEICLPTGHLHLEKIPILEAKMEDLKKLKEYIPQEHYDFWEEIFGWPTENRVQRVTRVQH